MRGGRSQARVNGDFDPAAQRQLLEDIVDVALYGLGGDTEPAPDLFVAQAVGNQLRDIPFPRGHVHVAKARQALARRVLNDLREQRIGERLRKHALPRGYNTNAGNELTDRSRLEHEPRNAFLHQVEDPVLHREQPHQDQLAV